MACRRMKGSNVLWRSRRRRWSAARAGGSLDMHAVMVGGETNGYWRTMDCTFQKTVSVDAWR